MTTYFKIKDSRLFILPETVEGNESIIGFQMVKFPQEIYTHQGRTLHRVFEFNNRLIGVGWLRSKINNINCLRIGLFDAYEGRIVFDGDCIEGSIEKIETKEGGGAILVDKAGFYLGIGAPDIDNDFISSWFDVKNGRFDKGFNRLLPQLDNSIFGKILFLRRYRP